MDILNFMMAAMVRYGLDGRAYEYDSERDEVIVWATNEGAQPRYLTSLRRN
jgi:hypothetical protein